jgi:hypothetical protein
MVFFVAVGMVVTFGGVALAGGFGECSSGSHNQAVIDKTDAKPVAIKAPEKPEKADADKVVIAQTADKSPQPTQAK